MPAPNLPSGGTALSDHAVAFGEQSAWKKVENGPTRVTRFANRWITWPYETKNVAEWEHVIVPPTVATRVLGFAVPFERSRARMPGAGAGTITLKVAGDVFPDEKPLAVQTTVVVPTGKVAPEGGAQLRAGLGSTLSVAVTVYEITAPLGSSASTVTAKISSQRQKRASPRSQGRSPRPSGTDT